MADRPWSSLEAEEAASQILDALHTAVEALPRLATAAASAEHFYRVQHAMAVLEAKGSNQSQRDAAAYIAMNELAKNAGVPHPRLDRDLKESAYRDQRSVIRKLEVEAGICQTLIVSHRALQS